MGYEVILITAFVSISAISLAVGLVVREWWAISRGTAAAPSSLRLRRTPDVFDRPASQNLSGKIDLAFDRLVQESGTELTSGTIFQIVIAGGLILGGTMWLYHDEPLMGVLGAMSGMAIPLLLLSSIRTKRMRQLRDQLPHAIETLARATRAGRSVEQAIELVSQETEGVLAQEFLRCQQQLNLGRSFEKTLRSLANRVRVMEMQILATTLIVQRQSGGPLSETLERMTTVIRERLAAQRQVRAATAAGRMSTLVVASIAPLIVIFLFSFRRDHLFVLFDDVVGRSLLLLAMVLEIIGLIWVVWLMRSER
ncbi:hypothetical protein GC163_09935 [bacterium]|nr:hypothetical protein [bacterium]